MPPASPPAFPSPLTPPASPPAFPSPLTPPISPPDAPTPLTPPPGVPPVQVICDCDVYKQGAKSDEDYYCCKKEKGEYFCVPPIWTGAKKPAKYDELDVASMYKCAASDWKLCYTEAVYASPSAPTAPSMPPMGPLPPSRPTNKWAPSPPPFGPSASVVPCENKKKAAFCLKKKSQNKCYSKKVQKKCPLTCGATCVA